MPEATGQFNAEAPSFHSMPENYDIGQGEGYEPGNEHEWHQEAQQQQWNPAVQLCPPIPAQPSSSSERVKETEIKLKAWPSARQWADWMLNSTERVVKASGRQDELPLTWWLECFNLKVSRQALQDSNVLVSLGRNLGSAIQDISGQSKPPLDM